MATIRKRGNKYQAQVRRHGHAHTTKTFCTFKDTKEWTRHVEGKIDRHELGPDRDQLKRITLADLVVRYRDEVVPVKKGADIETIVLNAFLRHPICNNTLAVLNTSHFATYRNERLQDIKASSLKRQLAPLHNMFEIGRDEWGIPLDENPLDKLTLKATDNRRERQLREGEYERLLGQPEQGEILMSRR